MAGVGPSSDGGFDSVRLLQISTCFRARLLRVGVGWGGVNSLPRSPCLQEVPRPLNGGTSFFSKCRLLLDAVYILCNHIWPYRGGAVLLPDGHGVGLLALGHGLLCRCWLALRLLRWSEVLDVHLDERVFPVSLCPGRSSRPSWAISRDRAVSPSSGGATASSHLRNSFGLPHSGQPQCDICPFCCSFILNPQTFPQVARWHPWSVRVLAMRSFFSGRGCFFLSTRSI